MTKQAALEQMISQQVRTWAVLDARTLAAMKRVPREHFVPEQWRSLAYGDCAVPMAHHKYMLTPMLVGRMLQALAVRSGEQVLEIGTGSGYLAACLATQGGRVQSWELHADLAASARTHLNAAGIDNVQVNTGDGLGRGPEDAFDAIVLTGSLPIYQPQFERALKPGGRLFVVVGTGPVMEARLVRRRDPHAYSSTVLFETTLAALEHAPAPPAFRF